MSNLCDINYVHALLNEHGFRFSKALGQNFIINPAICPRMAEESGIDAESGVVEVGPGVGVLSVELAKRAKKVVCIELDTRLLPVLDITLAGYDNIEVINADVMKLDLNALIKEKFPGMKVFVCANLPYYITSPVIMQLLQSRLPVEAITVMVQKEAAQRMCAEVGGKESGAVTVAVNYYSKAQKLFDVSAGSFMPAPKVDSSVMRLDVCAEPPVKIKDEEFFFKVVKAAFAQRRKTALNSLSSGLGVPKAEIAAALEKCGFRPDIRPESLTMQELAALSDELYGI